MTTLAALQALSPQGKSETLELKRSTAELRRAGETLCAFLNGDGGQGLVGVGPKGSTRRPAGRRQHPAGHRGEFSAPSSRAFVPFVYDDKPYKRVGSTTDVYGAGRVHAVLLDRNHGRHRWENLQKYRLTDAGKARVTPNAEARREVI